jgi:hypothetical protein
VIAAIVVLVNGILVPAVTPALLVSGNVMVPVVPIVTSIAERVAVDPSGDILIEARGHRCEFRIGRAVAACDGRNTPLAFAPFVEDGTTFVPLGGIARALGGEASFDRTSGTAELRLDPQHRLATPPPSGAPPGGPSPALTPGPRPAPPPPEPVTSPRPRRTPLPALPS